MTVTSIIEKVEAIADDVDELEHIPESERSRIKMMLDDVVDALDVALDEHGDERWDEDGDEDDDVF